LSRGTVEPVRLHFTVVQFATVLGAIFRNFGNPSITSRIHVGLTAKAPENGWFGILEDENVLLGWPIFQGLR